MAATGLYVSRLGYGAQNFGGASHPLFSILGSIELAQAERIVGTLLDAGINLFDTADSYADGEAETVLGQALSTRRHEAVLCTKVGNRTGPGPNQVGQCRVHLVNALEASLRRLNTDRIDLYLIHRFEALTRPEDTLRTLDDMVRQGKVRYIGCSNFAAWQIMKSLGIAALRQCEPFVCVQAYYSLLGRDIEREIVPMAIDQNLALITWGTLAGGFLTGKFTRHQRPNDASRRLRFNFPPIDVERGYGVVEVAQDIARNYGATVAQVALAWQLHKPFVTSVLFGARDLAQIAENLGALELRLSAEHLARLDDASRLPTEYPQWLFDRSMARAPGESRDWSKVVRDQP